MAFLLACPGCGPRSMLDFRFGGETTTRPPIKSSAEERTKYFYFRKNEAGLQREWWYHKMGCRKWFISVRDTTNNAVVETAWPGVPPR